MRNMIITNNLLNYVNLGFQFQKLVLKNSKLYIPKGI